MRIAFLAATIAILVPATASAFDYSAHCRMSNRALRMAAESRLQRGGLDESQQQLLRRLVAHSRVGQCRDSKVARTSAYGEWVAQVDWAVTPADFFLTPLEREKSVGYMTPNASADTVPLDAMEQLVRMPLQPYRLLHENSQHFGDWALYSYRLWHGYALQQARLGRLDLALVYSAFADHYLEDLFAPGHIYSPRSGLNDELSGGIHNRYNVLGAWFLPAKTESLEPFLAGSAAAGDALRPSLDSLVRAACGALTPTECLARMEVNRIAMFGDNQLSRSPVQELFVTLVVARSVADIMDAWASPTASDVGVDSFRNVRWCGYRLDPRSVDSVYKWSSPTVELPFGRYLREDGAGLPLHQRWTTPGAGLVTHLGSAGGEVATSVEWMYRARPGAWLGSSPGVLNFAALTEDRSTYWGVDARMPIRDERNTSFGPYIRWVSSLNLINSRASVIAGVRGAPGDRSGEAHAGVNFAVGFSVLYFEFRPEVTYNTRRGTRGGILSGFTLTLPRKGLAVPKDPMPAARDESRDQRCDVNSLLIP